MVAVNMPLLKERKIRNLRAINMLLLRSQSLDTTKITFRAKLLGPLITVRSSGARCAFADSFYMPLLTERMKFRQTGYKYFAPLEQPSVAS